MDLCPARQAGTARLSLRFATYGSRSSRSPRPRLPCWAGPDTAGLARPGTACPLLLRLTHGSSTGSPPEVTHRPLPFHRSPLPAGHGSLPRLNPMNPGRAAMGPAGRLDSCGAQRGPAEGLKAGGGHCLCPGQRWSLAVPPAPGLPAGLQGCVCGWAAVCACVPVRGPVRVHPRVRVCICRCLRTRMCVRVRTYVRTAAADTHSPVPSHRPTRASAPRPAHAHPRAPPRAPAWPTPPPHGPALPTSNMAAPASRTRARRRRRDRTRPEGAARQLSMVARGG